MRLFLLHPFQSHYYPVFGLARHYTNLGENVVFPSALELKQLVTSEGFIFTEFHYLSEYMIKNSRSFLGLLLKNLIAKEFYLERSIEFEKAFQDVQRLIANFQPSHVYIDQSMAEYYFFFKPYIENITILHTKVYSGKTPGIPPFTCSLIPKLTMLSKVRTEFMWFKELAKQRIREFLLKTAFLGKDEIHLWKNHCKKHGLDWKGTIDFKHALNRGIKNVENVVLAPREVEFPGFRCPEHVSFYGELSLKNDGRHFSDAYKNLKRKIRNERNKKVIYMAFGTLAQGHKVTHFFNTVISLIQKNSQIILIISKGNHEMELIASESTYVFDYVPQRDVLSFSDGFITHGGLGSVKEAFHHQVPMLVVPMNKYIDQPGNAARVKSREYGDYLDIDRYSEGELELKITNLVSKKKWYGNSQHPAFSQSHVKVHT